MTRVVAFDVDHTLLIDNKLERVAFLHLLEHVVRDGGRALGSLAEETERIDALLAEQRSGAFSIDDAVSRFVRERGVDPAGFPARYRKLAVGLVDALVVPFPDAAPTLAELRHRGYRLAVLTNGWNPLQARKVARLGFDGPVVVSADIGIQKPDSRAFEALTASLGVDPADVWYVGDDPRVDVAGAAGAGLHAVWIDAEGVSFPAGVPVPMKRIGALAELLALLPDLAQV